MIENKKKLDSNTVAEFDRYFTPKAFVVNTLPDPKSVRDFTEVYLKTAQKTYNQYRMVEGSWILINSNLATYEEVTKLAKTGGSATDPTSGGSVTTIGSALHGYEEVTADYQISVQANKNEFYVLSIKNVGTININITCQGTETIDDETSQEIGPYDCITIMSNNSNWIIV